MATILLSPLSFTSRTELAGGGGDGDGDDTSDAFCGSCDEELEDVDLARPGIACGVDITTTSTRERVREVDHSDGAHADTSRPSSGVERIDGVSALEQRNESDR